MEVPLADLIFCFLIQYNEVLYMEPVIAFNIEIKTSKGRFLMNEKEIGADLLKNIKYLVEYAAKLDIIQEQMKKQIEMSVNILNNELEQKVNNIHLSNAEATMLREILLIIARQKKDYDILGLVVDHGIYEGREPVKWSKGRISHIWARKETCNSLLLKLKKLLDL